MCTHIILLSCTQERGEKRMCAKMGRPTENPKTEQIKIRATIDDKELLEECCNLLGMTQYEVVMKGIQMVYESTKNKGFDPQA